MNVVGQTETGVNDRKVHYYNLMLTTKEDAEFEPYGAMPSFIYPSEPKTIKNSANIAVCNKNFYDATFEEKTFSNVTRSADKNVIKMNGSPTSNGQQAFRAQKLPAGSYKVQLMLKNGTIIKGDYSGTQGLLGYVYMGTSYNRLTEAIGLSSMDSILSGSRTFVLTEPTSLRIGFFVRAGETYDNAEIAYQITQDGADDFDFVGHEEQAFAIPIQQEMLSGDGFEKVNGVWKEKHGWTSLTENGSTNTMAQQGTGTTGKYRYTITPSVAVKESATDQALAYCDKFKLLKATATHGCATGFTVSESKIWIYDEGESLTDFKAKLADNPITFKIQLVEATYLDCTEEQKAILDEIEKTIHTYKEKTHIYSTDNFSPVFDVKVKKDTQLYIESQINSKLENINQVIVERS